MARRIVHMLSTATMPFEIRLIQLGVDRFEVVYGQSVKTGLTYAQAAFEYGAAIMHALALKGELDNRERRR